MNDIVPQKKEKRGGKRDNSGRKKKEIVTRSMAKQFSDYFSEEERVKLLERAREMAWTDPIIMKFVLEQIYGKAPQALLVDTNNTVTVNVHFVLHNQPRHLSALSPSETGGDSSAPGTV